MDLALNNLQILIWYKIQPTNQPTNIIHVCISKYSFCLDTFSTHQIFLVSILFQAAFGPPNPLIPTREKQSSKFPTLTSYVQWVADHP